MASFYASLAQITATLVAILGAAVAAYFVFLQDRSAQLDEKIEEEKIAIRETLLNIRSNWPWPLQMYLPPEFADLYRSKHPEKSRQELLIQAVGELVFLSPDSRMGQTIDELQPKDSFGGPWAGRIYFWIFTEAVTVLTVGTPDTRTKPEGVFPSSATGPGFDEWRRNFDRSQTAIQILRDFRAPMVRDFRKFAQGLQQQPRSNIAQYVEVATAQFFEQIDSVKARLKSLDKNLLLQKRYSFTSRVRVDWLLLLSGLAFFLGVVLPLGLLAWKIEIDNIGGSAILVSVLALTIGAFARFGWDISAPLRFGSTEYATARWYTPLIKELEIHEKKVEHGGLVDREFFIDAARSGTRAQFPRELVTALDDYLERTEIYNTKALRLSGIVAERIKSDPIMGDAVAQSPSQRVSTSVPLHPADVLDEARLNSVIDSFRTRDVDISISVDMPRWIREDIRIPRKAFGDKPEAVAEALRALRLDILNGSHAEEFLTAREDLVKSGEQLRRTLEAVIAANS